LFDRSNENLFIYSTIPHFVLFTGNNKNKKIIIIKPANKSSQKRGENKQKQKQKHRTQPTTRKKIK